MKLLKKLLPAFLAVILAVHCCGCWKVASVAGDSPPAETAAEEGSANPGAPSGACVLINKKVDNLAGDMPFVNAEHMSALFLDSQGDWYFFFWGTVVTFERIDAPEALESMDSLNSYLFEHGFYEREDRPYFRSVYIEGDFSASIDEARRLKSDFAESEGGFWGPNGDFSLTEANCSQVVMRLVELGALPDGSNIGDYFKENGISVSVVPNQNMTQMQRLFGNTALNYEEYAAQIGS